MAKAPLWFKQLTWELPWSVAALRAKIKARQSPIPSRPGCYVFTNSAGEMVVDEVLYVGKAVDLRRRVTGYLVDYMKTKATKHKGRAFVFEYREIHTDDNIYVRWAIYGDPIGLEGGLIGYLHPQLNDRLEYNELADDGLLDPTFLP
jgi:hypothetical protein